MQGLLVMVTEVDWRLSSQTADTTPPTTFRNGILYLESASVSMIGAGVDVSAVCASSGHPVQKNCLG
jgi:hypothetical protein